MGGPVGRPGGGRSVWGPTLGVGNGHNRPGSGQNRLWTNSPWPWPKLALTVGSGETRHGSGQNWLGQELAK